MVAMVIPLELFDYKNMLYTSIMYFGDQGDKGKVMFDTQSSLSSITYVKCENCACPVYNPTNSSSAEQLSDNIFEIMSGTENISGYKFRDRFCFDKKHKQCA